MRRSSDQPLTRPPSYGLSCESVKEPEPGELFGLGAPWLATRNHDRREAWHALKVAVAGYDREITFDGGRRDEGVHVANQATAGGTYLPAQVGVAFQRG